MKKIIVLIMICMLFGCEVDRMKVETCTFKNPEIQSDVKISAYHDERQVDKIVVELRKQFDLDIIKKYGHEKIKQSVKNSLHSTIGEDTAMELEFDEKESSIYVKITMLTKDMNSMELESFNLDDSKAIKNFVEEFESLGYSCKESVE